MARETQGTRLLTQGARSVASVVDHPVSVPPVYRATQWCVEGFRLWARHPFRLLVLSLLPLLVEALLQSIPWAGMLLSKLITPMFGMGVLFGLAHADQSGRLPWSSLFYAWHPGMVRRALGLAAITAPAIFAMQQVLVAMMFGWPAVDVVLLGHAGAHPALVVNQVFRCLLILSGVPLSVLLGLAPFALLDGATPWRACTQSARIVWRNGGAFTAFGVIQLLGFAAMLLLPWGMLLIVLLLPWSSASVWLAWQDVDASARDA
ncbi:hypothetical protein [Dyella telluris]|uniref:DUF2189 domain-containing protein n=1 Tax=Dyella telluris TaxID=2763498 RepID=A0A7G8Q2W6_9GAMM|nr:hypothetical protein [Dyella telluris]QNK01124.1 hypothetical protein H8F01_19010 [Dyella telluris]